MPRHKAFETAAGRRRNDPVVWTIDGIDIRLVSAIHIDELADLVDALNAETDETNPIRAAAHKRGQMLEVIRRFINPDDLAAWENVEPDIDTVVLSSMATELILEYSGAANPTRPSSSSAGSEPTGASSTDGAAPEQSTPSA